MAPQKHSPLCVAVIFTSPGFDKKLSKNPKIGMNDSSLLEYMSRRQLRFEEGGAVVLAVALVLVVLRCDEALDREVRRPLHTSWAAPLAAAASSSCAWQAARNAKWLWSTRLIRWNALTASP